MVEPETITDTERDEPRQALLELAADRVEQVEEILRRRYEARASESADRRARFNFRDHVERAAEAAAGAPW